MDENMRIIEVNGVKLEIDMRTVKRVDSFRVGHRLKVLRKTYSGYESLPGVLVGIDEFKALPTLVVACVKPFGDGIEFVYINAETKDSEICAMSEEDIIPTRDTVLGTFDQSIQKAEADLLSLHQKRAYFVRMYGALLKEQAPAASVG